MSLLKFLLDFVQVINLVISHLQVFRGLSSIFSNVLLFLIQLVNDFILIGNLIFKRSDSMIPVGPFLLKLLNSNFEIFNLFLYNRALLLKIFLVSCSLYSFLFSSAQKILSISELNLKKSLLFLLNNFIFFKQLGLSIQFILVDTIGGISFFLKKSELFLRVWHSNERSSLLNDDKPSPISESHKFSKLSLAYLNKFSLISTLAEFFASDFEESLTLQVSKQTNDNVITLLFKEGKGVTQTISFSTKFNFIHKSINSSFVISRAV